MQKASTGSSQSKDLKIQPGLILPARELSYRYTPSSGPGGQNVNKVSARVELLFNVAASKALKSAQKHRILEQLGSKISRAGFLRVVAQEERSQLRNIVVARRRLAKIIRQALYMPAKRHHTAPTRASKRKRQEAKMQRGDLKKQRRRVEDED